MHGRHVSESRTQPALSSDAPRVRVEVLAGQGAGRSIELVKPVSLFGARAGCKIILNHVNVSPAHAALVNTGSAVYVRDLVTSGGTMINNMREKIVVVENGDELAIGSWKFRIHVESSQFEPSHTAAPPATPRVELVGRSNGDITTLSKPVCVIGRRGECDLSLPAENVSRTHSLILPFEYQPAVFDLLSTVGTRVNGKRVRFARLSSGDVLEIGRIPYDVRILPASDQADRSAAGTDIRNAQAAPPADITDMIDLSEAET